MTATALPSASRVTVYLKPLLGNSDPLRLEFTYPGSPPATAKEVAELFRDQWLAQQHVFFGLQVGPADVFEFRGFEKKGPALTAGFFAGMYFPEHDLYTESGLLAGSLLAAQQAPQLSARLGLLPPGRMPPRFDTKLILQGYQAMLMMLGIEQGMRPSPEQRDLELDRFILDHEKCTLDMALSVGWMLGAWFPDKGLKYPMPSGDAIRIADPGSLVGGMIPA